MKLRIAILCCCLCTMISMAASSPKDSILVTGHVKDAFTHKGIEGATVSVRSTHTDFTRTGNTTDLYAEQKELSKILHGYIESSIPTDIYFELNFPDPGKYQITVSAEGYNDEVVEVTIPEKQYNRRTKTWELEDINLQRIREKVLDDVTVTATKIMMVHRGDTVVYNADYFQLSQGSMLDELISMMPGLEIRPGGEIFYQGNKLANLLVNGKDFFKGDPAIALENLPAYTVKEVKIYQKGDDDEFLDIHKKRTKKRPNTLDVILKKEYSHGWIANTELAGGLPLGKGDRWENRRFLLRLFGLHYGLNSRLGMVGNLNNINDSKMANTDGYWNGDGIAEGTNRKGLGALMYSYHPMGKNLEYDLTAKVSHDKLNVESHKSVTNFLDAGETFNRSRQSSATNGTQIDVENAFNWKNKKMRVYLNVHNAYNRHRNTDHLKSAQFSESPMEDTPCATLDSIYAEAGSERLWNILTNRVWQNGLTKTERQAHSAYTEVAFLTPFLGNHVKINASFSYDKQDEESFQHYDLRYGRNNATGEKNDYRNRYFDHSETEQSMKGGIQYDFGNMMSHRTAEWLDVKSTYNYSHNENNGNRGIYNLHTLGESDNMELGTLPSLSDWRAQSIDPRNSREQRFEADEHTLISTIRIGKYDKPGGELLILPTLKFQQHHLTDSRTSKKAGRTFRTFDTFLDYTRIFEERDRFIQSVSIEYRLSHNVPSVYHLLQLSDDSNPLSVSHGNPNLKKATTHWGKLDFGCFLGDIDVNYSYTCDAVAMGYCYNPTMGAYSYRPENVNGNWSLNFSQETGWEVDKKKRVYIRNAISGNFLHSVDIINQSLSKVDNYGINDRLTVTWRMNSKSHLIFRTNPWWQYAVSDREGFKTRNTWDINYHSKLVLKPVRDIDFDTELMVCSRYGYDNKEMNGTEMALNMSVGWNFDFRKSSYQGGEDDKGTGIRPWMHKLTGYDLLQQLSNTRRTLNAQGITEVQYNTMPSYVMLHLAYKFHKQPKKR